jgi:hypothetical protein
MYDFKHLSFLYFTELKKVSKLKCPSKDASVPLGREESNHKWGGREGSGRESGLGRGVGRKGERY